MNNNCYIITMLWTDCVQYDAINYIKSTLALCSSNIINSYFVTEDYIVTYCLVECDKAKEKTLKNFELLSEKDVVKIEFNTLDKFCTNYKINSEVVKNGGFICNKFLYEKN